MIVCVYVWVCVLCVKQLIYKKIYIFKMSFFMIRNGQFFWDWKAFHSQSIFWMSARPIHVVTFQLLIPTGGGVLPLRRNFVKENKGVWRRRIYRKYASCRWLKDAGLEFTRRRSFRHVTRFSWPMVFRDWICDRPPSLWEQVAYRPK